MSETELKNEIKNEIKNEKRVYKYKYPPEYIKAKNQRYYEKHKAEILEKMRLKNLKNEDTEKKEKKYLKVEIEGREKLKRGRKPKINRVNSPEILYVV